MKQHFFNLLWISIMVSLLTRIGMDHKRIQDVADCNANLKRIATALEMYSTDNAGCYPKTLEPLVPLYLSSIPDCPSSGRDSYSSTLERTESPDTFTIGCRAKHPSLAGEPTVQPIHYEDVNA